MRTAIEISLLLGLGVMTFLYLSERKYFDRMRDAINNQDINSNKN